MENYSWQSVYEESNYRIFYKNTEIILRVNRISPDMDLLLEETGYDSYSFITAANPYSTLKSEQENRARNLELEELIIEKQFLYYKGRGESVDLSWKEDSFCILGIDKELARAIADLFLQNAFLFGIKNSCPEIVWVH